MADVKTKKNNTSALQFVNKIQDVQKKNDCKILLKIFEEVTKEKPKMWGTAIIGFGQYHYKSERSAQEADWPLTSFSPRKNNITLYIKPGFDENKELLKKLGKHKISGGACIYINRLSDIDISILKKIIKNSFQIMKKKYHLS